MAETAAKPAGRFRGRVRDFAVLAGCALAATLAFHLKAAAEDSLWIDEMYSVRIARLPAREIVRESAAYTKYLHDHPPLYFLALRAATGAWGESPLALRALSLAFGAALAAAGGLLARGRGGSLAGGAAFAALLSAHPHLGFQIETARMYGLVVFECLIAAALFDRIVEGPPGRPRLATAGGLAFALAAIFYTNYHGLLFAVGVGIAGGGALVRPSAVGARDRGAGGALLLACGGAALLATPWLPTLLRMKAAEAAGAIAPPAIGRPAQAANLLAEIAGVRGLWLHAGRFDGTAPIFLAASALALAGGWIAFARLGRRRAPVVARAIALGLMPAAILALAAPESRAISIRYTLWCVVFVWEGAALGWIALAGRIPTATRRAAGAIALVALPVPIFLWQTEHRMRPARPDWRRAAAIVERNVGETEYVLTGGFLAGGLLEYHMARPERVRFLHGVFAMDAFDAATKDPRVVWYVNAVALPEAYATVVRLRFPYAIEVAGPRGNLEETVSIRAKRPFVTPEGEVSPIGGIEPGEGSR